MGQSRETMTTLLEQAKTILDIRNRKKEQPGERFNIFSVLNVEDSEVDTHSRLIYELLSPDGSHGMGNQFICAFFEIVLHKPFPQNGAIRIHREKKAIVNGQDFGRIDLLIEGTGFCYPIEVKIYAEDQWKQLERYAQYSMLWKKSGTCQVYYLTLDGHEPSKESLGSLHPNEVICLSFGAEIQKWLERCGELAWQSPVLVDVIKQYQRLLEKLTGVTQGDEYMELIKNTISKSKADYESAAAISDALTPVRIEMMQKVFDELVEHVGGQLKLVRTTYAEDAVKYYTGHNRVWPSATFLVQKCGGLNLALNIEVDWKLYCGLIYYEGGFEKAANKYHLLEPASEQEAWKEQIKKHSPRGDWDWNLEWRYIPETTPIDFHNCGGNYPELYDPAAHELLLTQIFAEVDNYIQELRDRGLLKQEA